MSGVFDDPNYYEHTPIEEIRANAEPRAARREPEPQASRKREPKRETQGREVLFEDVKPYPMPVEGTVLLDWIAETLLRYLVLPTGGVEAMTLWIVHAYAHELFEVSPILVIKSPAMRCGKTTTILLLEALVPRPLVASNMTAAIVFRLVEKYRPTLLMDEADTWVAKDNQELRGLLNSGHRRGGATAFRIEGESREPRLFSTWAPKVIASIGALAATLEDRAVTVPMRRKRKDEKVSRLRVDGLGSLNILRMKIAKWVEDEGPKLLQADPDVPESLDDRAADNWRPLLAIADLVGGDWPERARKAAIVLSTGRADTKGAGELLICDIEVIFKARKVEPDRISTADLLTALCELDGRPWAEWFRGRPLTANGLARLLHPFGVGPKSVRVGGASVKGYTLESFQDAFPSYGARSGSEDAFVAAQDEPAATGLFAPGANCSGVAAGAPPQENEHGDAWEAEVES